VPKHDWKLSDIRAREKDRLPEPAPQLDPALSGEFRTEQECIDAYEDALVRFGGCEWLPGSDGPMFVEHGNKLVPRPPDVPDTRGMDPDVADLAGSW
jgi:hypothetical protein